MSDVLDALIEPLHPFIPPFAALGLEQIVPLEQLGRLPLVLMLFVAVMVAVMVPPLLHCHLELAVLFALYGLHGGHRQQIDAFGPPFFVQMIHSVLSDANPAIAA